MQRSAFDVTQKPRELGAATLNPFPPYDSAAGVYVVLTLSAISTVRRAERRTDAGRA